MLNMKRGDTAPPITATLEVGGTAVDLEGATVRFHMRDSSQQVVVDAAANNDQVSDGSDGTLGMVSYDWIAGDTDIAGMFEGEWEVTFADSSIRTFPTLHNTRIRIVGDIA